MTVHYGAGSALRARKIVLVAERIRLDRKRVPLTSDHTGMRATARGEAFAYVDLPLSSVPRRSGP